MKKLINEFLNIYKQKLKYFNYSNRTIEIYSHYFEKFLNDINKYPQHFTSQDFEQYLMSYNFSSISQQNQIINALKFGYEKVLNRKYNKIDFKRPRKVKQLPQIIESEKLKESISKIKNLKHKAILSLAYSVGLRVSEICDLKIKDIDSNRMLISIRQAKGNKDRVVPLSQNLLLLLRQYYIEYKPKVYLFNGQSKPQYTPSSCNQLIKKYIGEDNHFHQLRHSCFTALLENGTDLRIIQKIAGHSSSKTTEIYTHVSTSLLNKVNLPM